MGFKFWISNSSKFDKVSNIAPNNLLKIGSDMLEIATAPVVANALTLVEDIYISLINKYPEHDVPEISRQDWVDIFNRLNESNPLDFWKKYQTVFAPLNHADFKNTVYIKPKFPSPPLPSLLQSVTSTAAEIFTNSSTTAKFDPTYQNIIYYTHIGVSINPPARKKTLASLTLGVLRALKSKDLLASARYNNDLDTDSSVLASPFLKMVSLFDAITDSIHATPSTKWVLSLFSVQARQEVIAGVKMLASRLRDDTVSVWSATKVAFIPKSEDITGEKIMESDPMWALTQDFEGHLTIYLSDGHPCMEEAVIHSFMNKLNPQFHASAQACTDENFKMPVPTRIIHEIRSAYRSKMLTYVRNSSDVISRINAAAESEGETKYLTHLCLYVNECVRYLMIVHEQFSGLMRQWLNDEYNSENPAEKSLCKFLGEQTLSPDGLNNVVKIFTEIENFLSSGSDSEKFLLCYLAFSIYKACRHCAYLELKLAITDMSTQILPDKDQVAVCLEMATTQTTLQQIFNLSSLELAPSFHKGQRNLMQKAEEYIKDEVEHMKEFSFDNLDFSTGRQIGNSYIYIYPILIDMALNAAIGSGLFFSNRMDTITLQAATVAFLDPDVLFYKSPGPVACLQSVILLIPSSIICRLAFNDVSNSLIVWGIYCAMMILTLFFMVFKYSQIAKSYVQWPSAVKVTPNDEILKAYENVILKPLSIDLEEPAEQSDQRRRLWERSATEWFAEKMRKAVNAAPKAFISEPVLKKRMDQWQWERPLMTWFMQRSSVNPATVKSFSQEWDALLKQAIDALAKKYQVEKLNRGALLFQLESPAIVFGFLYFIITFLDKWAILCATGEVGVFIPNGDALNVAVIFATIYLLLSAGFLELTITSCSEKVNQFKYASMSAVEQPLELIAQYQKFTDEMYRSELQKLVFRSFFVFAVITAIFAASFGLNDPSDTIFSLYGIACFNYTGLLVGLFNKIFININENQLNKFLTVAVVLSTGTSTAMIKITNNNQLCLLATALSCWGPNLRTSGQRMIGFSSNSFTKKQLEVHAEMLLECRENFLLCGPSSKIGLSIVSQLEFVKSNAIAIKEWSVLQPLSVNLILVLERSIDDFKTGVLMVREVQGVLTAGGISYAAIARKSKFGTCEYLDVFVSGTQNMLDNVRTNLLCEAIVHEMAENLGFNHSTACVMETLLRSYANSEFSIPNRISQQLHECDSSQKDFIISRTQAESTKSSTFGFDVDSSWQELTHAEKEWLFSVSLIWNDSIRSFLGVSNNQNDLFRLCVTAPVTLKRLFSSKFEHSILQYCCQALLRGTLALKISELIVIGFAPPPYEFPKTIPQSPRHKISDFLNVHIAVTYFALTCDVSFSREASELPFLSRQILCPLFRLNQLIFNVINEAILFNNDSFITDFKLQSEQGVAQIRYYHQLGGKSVLKRIDILEGGDKKTATVADKSDTIIEIKRYLGSKQVNWEPKDNETPFAIALVQKHPSPRILEEKLLDAAGTVVKSHLYSFSTKSCEYPMSRLVFSKEIPPRSEQLSSAEVHALSHSSNLLEIHWFYTEGPLLGLVQCAMLNAVHKISKTKVKISVEFQHQLPFVSSIPVWGVFHREDSPNWEIVVEYAPFSDPGSPMQPWSVRYRDGDSNNVKVVIFDYSHPKHVTTKTILTPSAAKFELLSQIKGEEVHSPSEIVDDYFGILGLHPMKTAQSSCELITNSLKLRNRYKLHRSWPFIRINSVEYTGLPYGTREKRDMLWTAWRGGKIAGVFARHFDETILQNDKALKIYWRNRHSGNLPAALEYLRENRRLLSNVLYNADIPAKRNRLQIRYSDLAIFGSGGDSEHISSFDSCGDDLQVGESSDVLEAICLDSGTWPTGGGGVGSCRRDVVDSLSRVRWTAIAEIAGAELEHKDYQIEKNINAIIYLPIFDNDMGSPMENIYKTFPFRSLRDRNIRTTDKVVATKFVPIIVELINACLTENLETRRVQQDEQLILSFYNYFKTHDWRKSWDHPLTQRLWMATFLEKAKQMENDGRLLKHESPTLAHISMLFTLFSRLLLILSREIPKVPVVHVSHHGTQSLIAVVAKVVHGSSVIIWDHGMLWRERLFALGRDQMPSFAQIGFSGLTRLCTRLAYNRADYVTPCTNVQNVMWAAYLAGGKYLNDFERVLLMSKCSAVLNGMNLKRFSIKRELARKTPTAVMLSHISPVKDIMNAIKAAYHVVHEFKVSNYELHVYGSPNTDLSYTLTCNAAIKELNLENNVFLKGLGNPTNVLPTGWIFVNSSITEGLPLAIGEAGLCGLPVVCTDVGGSREVIADLKTGAVYGAVVPPSRPRQLALGQIQVFAMTDGLDLFVNLSQKNSLAQQQQQQLSVTDLVVQGPEAMMRRILDPDINALREKLGEMFRQKTMSVFSIARYCREHEQVLWLGELYSRSWRSIE
ncbi:hypothetical protein HK100_000181 [Physocladia obscura]|uniref:Uncharacterized protein n=1 Tax=Physocladia obscura TaxID=109957 RepID=A0AAD5XKF2_9FUNG|nr:hypothetical protein HK100_000181 [Physocladia obscura]